ncbi:penicillin-binding protein activator [Kordiimonas marina]|uniref:penicillin-binding protein activator n=1 Tax=Kordiimonas marina TaxID=2872312 RepID=UPI003CCFEB46|nr:penicillin-binding protein activator [Kordiimonas marina]
MAILLPLSGPERDAGSALLKAAAMALFDAYDPRISLMPFDTKGDPAGAADAARKAVDSGAQIVLGPLLGDNVRAAGEVLTPLHIPLLGFSNDSRVAAPGRYILGFLPETEIQRVIDYTTSKGLERYAALLPEGLYGDRVRAAFGDAVSAGGGQIMAMESYPPDAKEAEEPIKALARYDARRRALRSEVRFLRSLDDDMTDEVAENLEKAEKLDPVPYDVVLVPEGGSLLRTVATLLSFYEVDPDKVKYIGTGLWNDPAILKEPSLQGGWFAAPDPEKPSAFMARFQKMYDETPPRITTIAYDAMSLVATLARGWSGKADDNPFDAKYLTDEHGFSGVDGLFRLQPDGLNERALAILEVAKDGFHVVDPAETAFPAFGFSLRQAVSQGDN